MECYWWSRYGDFSAGIGILPHIGEVVAFYRKKRYSTQADFSIAAGVTLRTVQEWETSIMTADMDRRIFLAKMLKIPPVLLGLDWRLVIYQDNKGMHANPLEHAAEIMEEDSYYHYEDTLVMGWECLRKGGSPQIADRVEKRLRKLKTHVKNVPLEEREAWQTLLCQYYQLSSGFGSHHMRKNDVTEDITSAIEIATDLDDVELLVASLEHRARIHIQQKNYALAKIDAQAAMKYIERLRPPLKGDVYIVNAEVNALYAENDGELEKQIRQWQDRALNIIWKGNIEADRTFVVLNLAGIHHERTKTLLQCHKYHPNKKILQDARSELNLAWKALSPDLAEWYMYFYLTEARLYEAEHDLEASAKSGVQALKTAQAIQSKKGEDQVKGLYFELNAINEMNPYICNLGMELGIF